MTAFAYPVSDSGRPITASVDELLAEARLDTQEHRDVQAFYATHGYIVRRGVVFKRTATGFVVVRNYGRTRA